MLELARANFRNIPAHDSSALGGQDAVAYPARACRGKGLRLSTNALRPGRPGEAESFFTIIKGELIDPRPCPTRASRHRRPSSTLRRVS